MSDRLPQLTLELFDRTERTLEDFVIGPNTLVMDALNRWIDAGEPWFIYLWGREACGKTHLLHAAVNAISDRSPAAMYVPLKEVVGYSPDVLDGLEAVPVLAVDNVECVAGTAIWEEALFHLFNRTQANSGRLLISGALPAAAIEFELSDLSSRLASGLSLPVQDLSDADKQRVLQQRCMARGLEMSDSVAQYLLRRVGRDMHGVTEIFERIDRASLSAGRELTIPFVRDVLGLD